MVILAEVGFQDETTESREDSAIPGGGCAQREVFVMAGGHMSVNAMLL